MQYPKPAHDYMHLHGYRYEHRAYLRLRQLKLTGKITPHFYGHTPRAQIIYPPESRVPEEERFKEPMKAILIEYLDGELLEPEIFTLDTGRKVQDSIQILHDAGIAHRDLSGCGDSVRNVLLLRDGEVQLFDFEFTWVLGETAPDPETFADAVDMEDEYTVPCFGVEGSLYLDRYGFDCAVEITNY